MKKKILLIIVSMLCIVSLNCSSLPTLADEQPNIKADELRQKIGMEIEDYKEAPKITREQAIEIAKKTFPDLAISKNIKAQKNLLTDKEGGILFSEEELKKKPDLKEKGYIDKIPVWIVSFKGLKIARVGISTTTDEVRENSMHEEENVVIDAQTGEALYSFTFR